MELKEVLEEFIVQEIDKNNFYSMVGTADNISESKRTCDFTPIDGQAKRTNVRLQAIVSSTLGFVCIPKDNTKVVATFFDKKKGFISLTSEIDKMLIDTPLTLFNVGSKDGLININDLVTSLNVIEAKLDSLIGKYNAHIHITTATVSGGAPGVIAPTTSSEIAHGQTSVKGDWEDETVKH